jgi:hypothetical protein
MQSVIDTHVRRSNQIEEFYMECLEKSIRRIKRAYEEEQCTHMTLKLGEVAGLKDFSPRIQCTTWSKSFALASRELK